MTEAIEEMEHWIKRYDEGLSRAWGDVEHAQNVLKRTQDDLTRAMDTYKNCVKTRDQLKKAVEVLRASK